MAEQEPCGSWQCHGDSSTVEPCSHNTGSPLRGSRASDLSLRDLGMGGRGMEAPGSARGPKAELSQRHQEMRALVGLQGAASGCLGTGGSQPPHPARYHQYICLMSPRARREDFHSILRGKAPAEQGAAPHPAGGLAGGFQYPEICPEGTSRSLLLHPCLVLALHPQPGAGSTAQQKDLSSPG